MDKNICEFIDARRGNFISDLERLIKIKSVRCDALPGMPFGEGVFDALCEAKKIAEEHGFEMINHDGYVGEICFGDTPKVMLLAHLDVVPEGDNWTKPPYELTVEGDRLYGRGATDDKGAAVAMLMAIECCYRLFGTPKTGVRLVLGCGEETGSEDLEYYFQKREKLEYTFSPDADYPLINIEKGRYAPIFTKTVNASSEKTVLEFNGGTTANIVPEKANALISGMSASEIEGFFADAEMLTGAKFSCVAQAEGVRVFCTGKSAHAANPLRGINAQTALIKLINTLPLFADDVTDSFAVLGEIFAHSDTEGRSTGVKMRDDRTGELTLNFGVLSFDGEVMSGQLDLRLPMCANEKNVKFVIEKKLSDAGFAVINKPKLLPVHYVSEDAPIVKEALRVFEDYTGQTGKCLAIGGGTYVHTIEGGVAFGVEFSGTDYCIHGADEFAIASEMLLTAKMYAQIIKDLCY